jgi:hypothetical protein
VSWHSAHGKVLEIYGIQMKSSHLELLVTSLKEKSESTSRDSSLDLLNLFKKSSKISVLTDSCSTAYHSTSNSSLDLKEGSVNLATSVASPAEKSEPRTRDLDFKFNPLDLINKFKKPSTIIFTPFTSSYTSPTTTQNSWALQGIKVNPYGRGDEKTSYIMTGTTGSPFAAGGVGAVYVGAIDGKSTSSGSGSGQWINFNVPFYGSTGTSCYGADILSPGKGPGGIGNVDLVGTWTKSSSHAILGFYYEGCLSQLKDETAAPTQFKSFQALTASGAAANFTYLHSIDGGYAVGNFSTVPGYVGFFLNSGPNSGSYVYDPKNNSQINAVYKDNNYTYHTLFGIWLNNNNSYTVAGGGSNAALLTDSGLALKKLSGLGQGLPQDAVLGRGMLGDIDPLTGIVTNEKYYNYQNDPNNQIFTHFQGIYYAGEGVYEVPFDALTSTGQFSVGIAYIKRQENGAFSDKALWQTFEPPAAGSLVSNDSVAGAGSVGALINGSLTTFAALSQTQSYLEAAHFLH